MMPSKKLVTPTRSRSATRARPSPSSNSATPRPSPFRTSVKTPAKTDKGTPTSTPTKTPTTPGSRRVSRGRRPRSHTAAKASSTPKATASLERPKRSTSVSSATTTVSLSKPSRKSKGSFWGVNMTDFYKIVHDPARVGPRSRSTDPEMRKTHRLRTPGSTPKKPVYEDVPVRLRSIIVTRKDPESGNIKRFKGMGLKLRITAGRIEVDSIQGSDGNIYTADTMGEKRFIRGLRPGDWIVAVEGASVLQYSIQETGKQISKAFMAHPAAVTITVRRKKTSASAAHPSPLAPLDLSGSPLMSAALPQAAPSSDKKTKPTARSSSTPTRTVRRIKRRIVKKIRSPGATPSPKEGKEEKKEEVASTEPSEGPGSPGGLAAAAAKVPNQEASDNGNRSTTPPRRLVNLNAEVPHSPPEVKPTPSAGVESSSEKRDQPSSTLKPAINQEEKPLSPVKPSVGKEVEPLSPGKSSVDKEETPSSTRKDASRGEEKTSSAVDAPSEDSTSLRLPLKKADSAGASRARLVRPLPKEDVEPSPAPHQAKPSISPASSDNRGPTADRSSAKEVDEATSNGESQPSANVEDGKGTEGSVKQPGDDDKSEGHSNPEVVNDDEQQPQHDSQEAGGVNGREGEGPTAKILNWKGTPPSPEPLSRVATAEDNADEGKHDPISPAPARKSLLFWSGAGEPPASPPSPAAKGKSLTPATTPNSPHAGKKEGNGRGTPGSRGSASPSPRASTLLRRRSSRKPPREAYDVVFFTPALGFTIGAKTSGAKGPVVVEVNNPRIQSQVSPGDELASINDLDVTWMSLSVAQDTLKTLSFNTSEEKPLVIQFFKPL